MNRSELNYKFAFDGLRNVIPTLKEHKVIKVDVCYSGSGDEGCVDEIEFLDNNENAVPCEISDADNHTIRIAAETILGEEFPGWGNDGGSSGTISLDVESGKITVDHNWILTHTDSKEFQL